jgi:hypothetical protein
VKGEGLDAEPHVPGTYAHVQEVHHHAEDGWQQGSLPHDLQVRAEATFRSFGLHTA